MRVRTDLGSALFYLGKFDEAIPHYEAALAIDPNFVPAHINLTGPLAARGRIDEAIAHYRRALELDPSNALARTKLDKLLRGQVPPRSLSPTSDPKQR